MQQQKIIMYSNSKRFKKKNFKNYATSIKLNANRFLTNKKKISISKLSHKSLLAYLSVDRVFISDICKRFRLNLKQNNQEKDDLNYSKLKKSQSHLSKSTDYRSNITVSKLTENSNLKKNGENILPALNHIISPKKPLPSPKPTVTRTQMSENPKNLLKNRSKSIEINKKSISNNSKYPLLNPNNKISKNSSKIKSTENFSSKIRSPAIIKNNGNFIL